MWIIDVEDQCILGFDFLDPLHGMCGESQRHAALCPSEKRKFHCRNKSQPATTQLCYCAVLDLTINLRGAAVAACESVQCILFKLDHLVCMPTKRITTKLCSISEIPCIYHLPGYTKP